MAMYKLPSIEEYHKQSMLGAMGRSGDRSPLGPSFPITNHVLDRMRKRIKVIGRMNVLGDTPSAKKYQSSWKIGQRLSKGVTSVSENLKKNKKNCPLN